MGATVTVGTDGRPARRPPVDRMVRARVAAGVHPHVALGGASWTARDHLGLPGLVPGAPADAVVYPDDPRQHLDRPDRPGAVVLRGRLVRAAPG
ncbi:hypothetical protein [Plantactinospora sp. KLBMP9567]|uniref:hypothetical protein n=1 Tax=Plantactinospora sp. KLBMP9567 TaxID=3085900 RepID=UPI003990470C